LSHDVMLIGELARRTGTTTRALRFYEQEGLLTSERTAAGYRRYPESAVDRVRNIKDLLDTGFTVADVRAFLPYLDRPDNPEVFPFSPRCTDGYALVGAQRVEEVRRRIAELTAQHDRLLRRMPWLAKDA
jgi:DNA-binding transcriptional MerR regulator